MNKFAYSFAGLVLVATAAHAQPAADVTGAIQADAAGAVQGPEAPSASDRAVDTGADVSAEAAADAAVDTALDTGSAPAFGAPAASPTVALSDTDVESFAMATVRLQAIQADATIAADQKQTAMATAVAEAGLDPARYNEIGAKVSADDALRARVQTAMARHAEHNDG